jgi:hypothetical protein
MNEILPSESACVPNGFGLCMTHPVCDYMRGAVAELQQLAAKWERLHDNRTKQVETLQTALTERMAWRLTKACESQAELLRDYARWEGDLVLCPEAWDTKDGLPKLTQELHDRLIALQVRRNVILKGGSP